MKKWMFEVFGPYLIDKATKGNPIPQNIKSFIWKDWEEEGCPKDMLKKVGCYVFGIRTAQGAIRPYYVGKATKGFGKEIFTADKLLKYNNSVLLKKYGTPVMFLIAHPLQKGKNNIRLIEELEYCLIGLAYKKNPEGLQNVHGVYDDKWQLEGFGKKGKTPKKVKDFARMLNLKH